MGCCRAITVLCESDAASRYPAEKNGVYHLTVAVKNGFKNPIFCYAAFNCICNFTHGNPTHKSYIVADNHNKDIITYIIEGMQKFRYVEEVQKNYHCEKVQISASLALQNLAADARGQKLIGSEGVEAVLGGMIAHVEKVEVVSAALGALINLCALTENAEAFLEEDGVEHLETLLQNPDVPEKSRVTTCKILQNIASSPHTAALLGDNEQTVSVILALLSAADYGSDVYCNVIKLLNTLLIRLRDQKIKAKILEELFESKLVDCLVDALSHNYEEIIDESKMTVQMVGKLKGGIAKIYKELATLVSIFVQSTNDDLKKEISSLQVASKLVPPCIDYPTPALLYYGFAIFFHVCDSPDDQITLIEEGILYFLFETLWYQSPGLDDNAIRLGCGTMIKLLSGFPNHKAEWQELEAYDKNVKGFLQWLQVNKPHLANLMGAIKVSFFFLSLSSLSPPKTQQTFAGVMRQAL